MSGPERIVIVGGGLAGAKAAETLRAEGFQGAVTLVGEEPERPYERPPLSKDYLRGETDREGPPVHEAGWYGEHDVDLRTGTRVTSIDPTGRTVTLDGGETLGWDRLLLALGAEPRRLRIPGADLDGVLLLRTRADSDRLRAAIEAGPLAVIGAGWVGSEVAASARQMGAEVTVIEREAVPLLGVLGEELGEVFAGLHRDHGVDLVTGADVEAIVGEHGRVEGVRLAGGRLVECANVVVGVGVAPRTDLAEAAGLAVHNGVLADATLQTSAEGIYAAGDMANAEHPFYGRRLRVEHWANAINQGETAARNMLGRGEPYDRIPYFFTDQYDLGMEYAGMPDPTDEVVVRGDLAAREFIAFWTAGGRVTAGMNVNVWDVSDSIQELIKARTQVDPDRLRDPDVPIESLGS